MKKFVLASLILPLLSGCFLYDCGYTRNDDTAIYKTDASNKMPITYSICFDSQIQNEHIGVPTEKSLRIKIEETLKQTGLFSEVSYDSNSNVSYHINFLYRDSSHSSGSPRFHEVALAPLTLCTLWIFPEWGSGISADLSSTLYLEGKPIWSCAHAEKCAYCVGWLVIPIGFVQNYWSVWRSIEYNIVRSTVNDLTREHIRRYLDPSSVELTNPEDVGITDTHLP